MNKFFRIMAALLAYLFLTSSAAQAQDLGRAVASLDLRVMALEQSSGGSTTLAAIRADLAALRACSCNTPAAVDAAQLRMTRIESSLTRLGQLVGTIKADVSAIKLVLEDHEKRIAALEGRAAALEAKDVEHDEAIAGLRDGQTALADDVFELKKRVDGIEDRERAFVVQFVAGATAGYAGDIGGESRDVGIFYKDGGQYRTSRLSFNPFIGASATYRRFYTDATVGFVGETANKGIGLRVQAHLGGNLGQTQRFTIGLTSFYEVVKSGGGDGGTYSVIDSRFGGGAFAKYAIWQSPQGSASVDVGFQVTGEGATAAVLTDRMTFGALRADGFLQLRLGAPRPPEKLTDADRVVEK